MALHWGRIANDANQRIYRNQERGLLRGWVQDWPGRRSARISQRTDRGGHLSVVPLHRIFGKGARRPEVYPGTPEFQASHPLPPEMLNRLRALVTARFPGRREP